MTGAGPLTDWATSADIAEVHGVAARRVEAIIDLLGVRESKFHTRQRPDGEREYSSALIAMIRRELTSRGEGLRSRGDS